MDPALHSRNRHLASEPDDHLSGVSHCCGAWEKRNMGIGNADGICEIIGKSAQTRTEHKRDFRAERGLRKQKLGGSVGVSESVRWHS